MCEREPINASEYVPEFREKFRKITGFTDSGLARGFRGLSHWSILLIKNENWQCPTFPPFLGAQKKRYKIQAHENGLESMHDRFIPEMLPDEYGGTAGAIAQLNVREEIWVALKSEPMRVIEMSTEQRWNKGARERENPRESPPTSDIVRHNSHMRQSDEWQTRIESLKDWFIAEEVKVSDESKRPSNAVGSGELFGMDGSFRKLTID
ncbi:hypothetical protein PR048_027743 [Dryococelus australis]|uniref:Uncharacterized protein n=1 Tax=Dryococelus australis TaxID=614101 RepID=A0ABQ9GHC5_9NEOP|nr:hypothetical protein PR048_027743 [Dryococelus australis]